MGAGLSDFFLLISWQLAIVDKWGKVRAEKQCGERVVFATAFAEALAVEKNFGG
jgi:hypothetical protein